ncbi:hypothetical protein LAZ67_14001729 [Cordylochernes scorpioides]|uniref:RNA-directed DNA polymerase n=1 Tax=Cordylochernes scorpioides TaxID=51811 RepID=A0ABY6L8T6_9ARAC|nr:hypothetical protein LAZ67_14001729 [Cordylochernes scorpioides]
MPGHRKRRQFKQTDAFTRGMVIGLKRAGWSIRQISADTHLGASTVHRLWRRWLEQENVAIYRNVGATRVTSARVDRRILRQAVAAPQATCTAILQHVQDTLDHSISTRTISRRLVVNGLHSCRPLRRLPLTPPNRRQRLEWCRARSTWMTEWHRVVFSDESRFCLSNDSRRVRVWRRRGERSNPAAIVERPTVRQRGIMVWGAIAYDSRSPLLRIQGTMTAQRYVDDVLRPVTLPYLQGVPNALYQQDNARPHTARISQQALQDVQMLPWPPYSPDLSPIEHVWDIIGRRLHALPQPRSEDELWQIVEREWRIIPQDAIRTLIDSLPRRVAACIAVRDYSVISEDFRRLIRVAMLSSRRPIIRVVNSKCVRALGRCILRINVNELIQPFEFIVLSECSHNVILGWDFLKLTRARINCAENELYLKEAPMKEELCPLDTFQTVEDSIIPPNSIKQMTAVCSNIMEVQEVLITCSKAFTLNKEIIIPASVVSLNHGRSKVWMAIGSDLAKIIPAGMKVAEISLIDTSHLCCIDGGNADFEKNENRCTEDLDKLVTLIDIDISNEDRVRVLDVLRKYKYEFEYQKPSLKTSSLKVKHRIETGDDAPIRPRPYRVSPREISIIQTDVDNMLKLGIIQPSESPWLSPVVLVKKRCNLAILCGLPPIKQNNQERCHFDETAPIYVHTDANGYGVGSVLVQMKDGGEKPIAYASRTLSKAERNYTTTEKECLAVIWTIKNFDRTCLAALFLSILYKKNYDPLGRPWLLVVPKSLRLEVLRLFHDALTAGHLGFAKTYDRIRRRFYWPGLFRSIRNYVGHCRECQRRKSTPQLSPGNLKPIIASSTPFQKIGIDLLGRFPLSRDDNRWVMLFTTAYHPQTNGLTERLNRTLGDMLSIYLDVEQNNWDSILPFATFAYNTAKLETTGFSPFYLFHGREAETMLDTLSPYQPDYEKDEYLSQLIIDAEDARQLTRLHTLRTQDIDRRRCDSRHRPVYYNVGDLVWIFTPVRKVGLSEKLF